MKISFMLIALVFLVGACVSAGRIQQTEPVRTTNFTGSPQFVAQCVAQRLGGRAQDAAFGEKYVIVRSAKRDAAQGLTHYSITVVRTGANEGIAEWRIVAPPEPSAYDAAANTRPGGRQTQSGLTDQAVQHYWAPVLDCAAQAKSMLTNTSQSSTGSPASAVTQNPSAAKTTEEKLKELKRLNDAGLISNEVYLEQQRAILSKP